MYLITFPVFLLLCGITTIILIVFFNNNHVLKLGANGIHYGKWHYLGRDGFIAWQHIDFIEEISVRDINIIKLVIYPNYIDTNLQFKKYINTWFKLGPSQGQLTILTDLLKGKHSEIFGNICMLHKDSKRLYP